MAEQSDIQSLVQMLADRMDRQEAQQQTSNGLLLRLVNQQEVLFNFQQSTQRSQEGFNERQGQFNTVFLDEIGTLSLMFARPTGKSSLSMTCS